MEEVNRGQRGGRHYRYSLAAHPEMVADGLAEDDTITDLDDDERGGVLSNRAGCVAIGLLATDY